MHGTLLAISDLHVSHKENQAIVERLHPRSPDDWLIVAGDVAERVQDVVDTVSLLRERFARVIWTPGNHELWTTRNDPVQLRGVARYEHLVELLRRMDVVTPEDPFPVWDGPNGSAVVAPLFLGYDYTFRPAGTSTKDEALAVAREAGVVCTDEYFLHPDPYPSREAWCQARVRLTEQRLLACDPGLPLVLVNHYPLVREPTRVLRYQEFAQWCGTELTADWHTRFSTAVMVYGHLHIPRTTDHDGIRFEEVSLGYPREWRRYRDPRGLLRQILPEPPLSERPDDRFEEYARRRASGDL
jgi:3',5'-cyclic AMP phosphodiesterase CpdA